MSDSKNYETKESNNDLKHIDAKKTETNSDRTQSGISDLLEGKLGSKITVTDKQKKNKKKNLPVLVDIIVGVLVISIAIGIVAGAFMLFRYYTDDYGAVNIEYTVVAQCEGDFTVYRVMKNKELYMDTDGNTLYFGKITDVEVVEGKGELNTLILNVTATAKYKQGSGYSIGENRIAVGSEYILRSETISIDGTVVELDPVSENGGK